MWIKTTESTPDRWVVVLAMDENELENNSGWCFTAFIDSNGTWFYEYDCTPVQLKVTHYMLLLPPEGIDL